MIDLERVDRRWYDDITMVVDELADVVGLEPGRVLLVGAGCRDILHVSLGHTFSLSATADTDLGIAVSDWSLSDRIESAFPRIGSNGIRYRVSHSAGHGRICTLSPEASPFLPRPSDPRIPCAGARSSSSSSRAQPMGRFPDASTSSRRG